MFKGSNGALAGGDVAQLVSTISLTTACSIEQITMMMIIRLADDHLVKIYKNLSISYLILTILAENSHVYYGAFLVLGQKPRTAQL